MVQRIDSIFQAYEFTEDELIVASTFTELQTRYLQTELSLAATAKVNLSALREDQTSVDLETFRLAHEYERGKMDMLHYLLGVSEDRITRLQETLAESVAKQQADSPELPLDQSKE